MPGLRPPPAPPPRARHRLQLALPWAEDEGLVAGIDEAGRGPLAGPVVVAAVILDPRAPIEGLADSKVLSPRQRERLHDEIRAKALCCSVAEAGLDEIERLNILGATLAAMRRAFEGLRLRPRRVLVDGNQLPQLPVRVDGIVGGDATVHEIAAASILAKVTRDRWCESIDARYPAYGFARHKGYGTAEHLAAIARHGPCDVHRRTFAPVRDALAQREPG